MRESIMKEIQGIIPLDNREAKDRQDCLDWIESGADLYRIKKPATPAKHLVSYFVLVDGDYILLVDHINAQLWLPTGGHVEPEEHPRTTALREAEEELSIEAEFLQRKPLFITSTVTVGKTAGHTDVSLWYVLKGQRDMKLKFDQTEFKTVKWFHKNNISFNRTDPELSRFLKKLYGYFNSYSD